MTGFGTLLYKELLRFWKVGFQTVAPPILTALLYLLIFSHVLKDHVQVYPGVSYTAFLIPGLSMMSLLQNSFANTASSMMSCFGPVYPRCIQRDADPGPPLKEIMRGRLARSGTSVRS